MRKPRGFHHPILFDAEPMLLTPDVFMFRRRGQGGAIYLYLRDPETKTRWRHVFRVGPGSYTTTGLALLLDRLMPDDHSQVEAGLTGLEEEDSEPP